MYTRAQPYIYGILIGYVLYKMRGQKLNIHWVILTYDIEIGMTYSLTWMSFQTTNVVLWSIAFVAAWECIFGISHLRRGHKYLFPKWSTFEAAVYEMLTRLAWSFSMGWVVIACVKGHGGIINKFLSWGVFQSLAKVSYMVYLTHLTVMYNLWAYTRTYETENSHFYQVI